MAPLTLIATAILGWACGALINWLADVLPFYRKLRAPLCLHCGERFPLLNYLFWPRVCPNCTGLRTWRTWVVELISAAAAVLMLVYPPARIGFWGGMVLLVYFGVVAVIDLEHKLILRPVSLVGAGLGLILGWLRVGPLAALIGGALGYGLMLAFYWLGTRLTRVMSKRRGAAVDDALGFGDVYLAGILGLLLGWPQIIQGLFVGFLAGALFSSGFILVMAAMKRYRFLTAIPYGPFLLAGAVWIIFFNSLPAV